MEFPKIPPMQIKRQLKMLGKLKSDIVLFGMKEGWFDHMDPHDPLMPTERDITIFHEDGGYHLEVYIAATRPKQREREILELWAAEPPFMGVFEVRENRGIMLGVYNFVDELEYAVSAAKYQMIPRMRPGMCVLSQLAPTPYGYWVWSGGQTLYEPGEEEYAWEVAASLVHAQPSLRFRNPELLRRAREDMLAEHERWVEHFGSSYVRLPSSSELSATFEGFHRALLEEGEQPVSSSLDFGELDMGDVPICVVHHPRSGLMLGPAFVAALELVRDPGLADDSDKQAELDWLFFAQDEVPFGMMQLAEEHPEEFNAALRLVLEDPDFDWARDGELLMREHYPSFDADDYPKLATLDGELVEAYERSRRRGDS